MPSLALGLSLRGRVNSASAGVSPVVLFAAGEVGAWYDPSDLTSLFQDQLGQTPITAAGQKIGMMMDQSRGRALGTLATAATWTNSANAWDVFSATGGSFTAQKTTAAASDLAFSDTLITVVAGRYYQITLVVSATTLSAYTVNLTATTTARSTLAALSGTGTKVVIVQATTSGTFSLAVQTAVLGSISVMSCAVREIAGNHAIQATDAQRPIYQIDGTGRPYLFFDGVDDNLATGTITPGTDKMQLFAGVRKLVDNTFPIIAELSQNGGTNNGAFTLQGRSAGSTGWNMGTRGTAGASTIATGTAAPVTNVITGLGDISAPSVSIRLNGAFVSSVTTTQGTGNFLSYPVYIGRRQQSGVQPFSGHLYSMVLRFGANLTSGQISSTEAWVNSKTGAY